MTTGALPLLDGLYLVESRTGMSNLFLVVFTNGALLAFSRVLGRPPEKTRRSCSSWDCPLGSPWRPNGAWSAVALIGLIALTLVWRTVRSGK